MHASSSQHTTSSYDVMIDVECAAIWRGPGQMYSACISGKPFQRQQCRTYNTSTLWLAEATTTIPERGTEHGGAEEQPNNAQCIAA
eukprot:scaffold95864_cov30-Tisochrysis_lutea.AAC.3